MNTSHAIPFLKLVADDLRQRFSHDLSRVAIVFPNKRAGIFFNDYITPPDGTPLWAPTYLTIDQIFGLISPLRTADDIETICLLYQIYRKRLGKAAKSLDWFYGWGEQLLRDFNDVDCAMADARQLFTNLYDIKKIEEISDPEIQQKLHELRIKLGLESSGPFTTSRIKRQFLEVWQQLYDIYTELNLTLRQRGLAYDGARKRLAVEQLQQQQATLPPQYDCFVFVGFNVLLQVEEQLFSHIQKEGKALFYWDYDQLLVSPQSPVDIGSAFRKNLTRFPSPLDASQFDNLSRIPRIDFVAATSDNAQARYVPQWLQQHLTTDEERHTAIVLADEGMLQSVVQSIPDPAMPGGPREVNITKGYPLGHTPAYASVCKFLKRIETDHADTTVEQCLRQLIAHIKDEALRTRGRHPRNSWQEQLSTESYFQCYTIANRLAHLAAEGLLDMQLHTLSRMLRQIMRNQSVAFHGEPATGLQVMGILETRCLDFDHLLMLSVSEGVLPRLYTHNSFIPYDVRLAFNLPMPGQKTAVFAYNFFRLLTRARQVTLVYNEATDGLKKGEMSRFMQQLLLLQTASGSYLPIHSWSLQARSSLRQYAPIAVNADNAQALMARKLSLSPTALSTYVDCPLKFFFKHVAYLPEVEKPTDFLPPNVFGTLFHEAAQIAYQELTQAGPSITPDQLTRLAESPVRLERIMQQAFVETSFKAYLDRITQNVAEWHAFSELHLSHLTPENRKALRYDREALAPLVRQQVPQSTQVYTPEQYTLEFHVITDYLKRLLLSDARLHDLRLEEMETRHDIEISGLKIGGIVDRKDHITLDGLPCLRIVDYKTGTFSSDKISASGLSELTTCQPKSKAYLLQTFLYSLVCLEQQQASADGSREHIVPALYFLQRTSDPNYRPYVKLGRSEMLNFADVAPDFKAELTSLIERMQSSPFTPTDLPDKCALCPYRLLCGET